MNKPTEMPEAINVRDIKLKNTLTMIIQLWQDIEADKELYEGSRLAPFIIEISNIIDELKPYLSCI